MRICVVYIVKEVASYRELAQLMGMAHNSYWMLIPQSNHRDTYLVNNYITLTLANSNSNILILKVIVVVIYIALTLEIIVILIYYTDVGCISKSKIYYTNLGGIVIIYW